jgi:hypothetical protein
LLKFIIKYADFLFGLNVISHVTDIALRHFHIVDEVNIADKLYGYLVSAAFRLRRFLGDREFLWIILGILFPFSGRMTAAIEVMIAASAPSCHAEPVEDHGPVTVRRRRLGNPPCPILAKGGRHHRVHRPTGEMP